VQDIALNVFLVLFCVAIFAGFIDSIAGGGGLITIPAMMIMGIPPLDTLGTNKLQAQFGSASATLAYARRGHVNLKEQLPMGLMAMAGGMLGALTAAFVPADLLRTIMPFLLIAIAIYFAFKPQLSDVDSHRRITPLVFGFTAAPLIGFWHAEGDSPYQASQSGLQFRRVRRLRDGRRGFVEAWTGNGVRPIHRGADRVAFRHEKRREDHPPASGSVVSGHGDEASD